jgi:two-component system, cell cycle sensor histidine kinase and response regulator CckA
MSPSPDFEETARLQAIVDSMRDGILVLGLDRRVLFYNRSFAELFHLPAGLDPADRGGWARALSSQLEQPGPAPIVLEDAGMPPSPAGALETLHLRDDRVVQRRVTPYVVDGRAAGLVAAYREITGWARAEEAIAEDRAILEKAQEVAHIGSWVAETNGTGRIVWSPEMLRIHGIEDGRFDGRIDSALGFVHDADRDGVRDTMTAAVREGRAFEYEHRIVRTDGAVRWVRINAALACDTSGKPVRLIGTMQDVTDRRQLEEQLRQAQKMEAIGRLAGGIAHDLNNALTAIAGFAELVLSDLGAGHPSENDVREVRKAAERAGAVTRQLLAFSRHELIEPRVFSLGETVTSLGRFLGRLLGDDIDLRAEVVPGVPPIMGDPGQVEQAIVNLAVNSRDAMPHGGRLTLAVRLETVDEAFAHSHAPMPPGCYVTLAVQDTGVGMSPETLGRIFEPFFTTKPVGKGTGLGLSMVYGTMKQCHGFIFAESEPGSGTTFRLYFPPATPPTAEASAADPAEAADHDAATVLVVDDDPAVRGLVVAALRTEGYRVVQAASGEEALRAMRETAGPIQLLLTDATMPGISGIELAARILGERPELPVIIMSGYTADSLNLSGLRGAVSICQKPFTPNDLRQRIRQALGR